MERFMEEKISSQLLVLCANLPRRKDRRFVIRHGLQSVCGVDIEFVDSADGYEHFR